MIERTADRVIRIGQIVMVIALAVGALLLVSPQIRKIADTSAAVEPGWVVIAVVALLVGLFVLTNATPRIEALASDAPARVKRQLFLICAGAAERTTRRLGVCNAIPPDFRKRLLPHSAQAKVVETILEHVKAGGSRTTFDIVIGPSGSGKTRAAMLLLVGLIRDREFCMLTERVFFYDFAASDSVQQSLLSQIGGASHSSSIIIVDNLHLAVSETLNKLTLWLVDKLQVPSERYVLLLGQPLPAWRIAYGGKLRLLEFATSQERLHTLSAGLDTEAVHSMVENPVARRRLETLHSYSTDKLASIAEVQSVLMDSGSGRIGPFAKSGVVSYLFDEISELPPGESRIPLALVLAVSCALAYQRGVFDKRDFKKCFLQVAPERGIAAARALWRAMSILKGLSEIGIAVRTSLPGNPFVLHEKLAEQFRDRLGPLDPAFESAFGRALYWRLLKAPDTARDQLHWLAAVETHDLKGLRAHFDSALSDGGVSVMARRLAANLDRFPSQEGRFQYGFVLDKMGEFVRARAILHEVLAQASNEDLKARCSLALIEAEHGDDATIVAGSVARGSDERNSLLGRYWELHLNAHAGRFDAPAMKGLADDLAARFQVSQITGDYALNALASRLVFDGCRHLYLQRPDDISARIQDWTRHPLISIVRAGEPCFDANATLYFKAHWRSHVQLSQLAIFDRSVADHAASESEPPKDVECLRQEAEDEYRLAAEKFSVFGNREALYLKGDIVNSLIQCESTSLRPVRVALSDYREFIQNAGFQDLASYPELLAFRLDLRAWVNALSGAATADAWLDGQTDYLQEARARLERVIELDQRCGNAYGLWRSSFYKLLVGLLGQSDGDPDRLFRAREGLKDLAKQASASGYFGDARIVNDLAKHERISVSTVVRALLFHPFVHQ